MLVFEFAGNQARLEVNPLFADQLRRSLARLEEDQNRRLRGGGVYALAADTNAEVQRPVDRCLEGPTQIALRRRRGRASSPRIDLLPRQARRMGGVCCDPMIITGRKMLTTTAESYAKPEAIAGAQQKRVLGVLQGGRVA
jgi:hypothetical protein